MPVGQVLLVGFRFWQISCGCWQGRLGGARSWLDAGRSSVAGSRASRVGWGIGR